MIDKVISIKNKTIYLCKWKSSNTFKCGKCNKGNITVLRGENGQGYIGPFPKKCKVCNSKIQVKEVLR